jgi:signal peptidase I
MKDALTMPTPQQLEEELQRVKYRKRYRRVLRSTVYTLVTVAAVAVLVATLLMPVLQIYGGSMTPSLTDGDIVLTLKTTQFETGDVVAFYYNNKILVRRVVASGSEQISIDLYGAVSVNGKKLKEPYVQSQTLGQCNINFPYNVPDSSYFVLGDSRSLSMDSRLEEIGVVTEDRLIGEVVFSLKPFKTID